MSDFKTIDDLMAGRAPGSVVLVSSEGDTFIPFYKDGGDGWYGLGGAGHAWVEDADAHDWKLHTPEPAPAVVERPQLWWFLEADDWILKNVAMTREEAEYCLTTSMFVAIRPSGIYLPEEK